MLRLQNLMKRYATGDEALKGIPFPESLAKTGYLHS